MPRDPNFKYNFIKIVLDNITNGQEFYAVYKPNNRRHTGTYTIGDDFWYDGDRHKQYITEETKALFEKAETEFMETTERAKNGLDGYAVIKVADYCLAYKKLPQELLYSFVLVGSNYTAIFTVDDILYFLNSYLIMPTCSIQQEKADLSKMYSELLTAAFKNNDLYLAYIVKEHTGTLTQDEADYLYGIDKILRFVPEDKIYDKDDIEITEVKWARHGFSCVIGFVCTVLIESRRFTASWYSGVIVYGRNGYRLSHDCGEPNTLIVQTNSKTFKLTKRHTIKISDHIRQNIESKARLCFGELK